ncbi:MAG: aldo/keto reductase [Deltaproteobacteria bacterium]|jgi:predicted aldo/keto reductase-like oxidoreductase|nr:aldo/keto reductase [Deltaproteobacteria bacterium]
MIENRAMGRTGDSASILGFGCMRLPLNGPKPTDIDLELSTAMLRSAIDRGVSYVDTAYVYHSSGDKDAPGESEAFLGKALKDGYREKVRVATKLPLWHVNSRADMDKYLDRQLKILDVGRIDYYLAHGLGAKSWPRMRELGLTGFFEEAVKDGRIRFPSFSFHDDYPVFEDILKGFDWALALVQYNYLDEEYQAGTGGVRLARDRGVAIAVMEPLRGGFLVRHLPEEDVAMLRRIRPDWSMAAWAFNWLWSRPGVSVVLSGMSDMAQVDDNVRSAQAYRDGIFGEAETKAIAEVVSHFKSRIKVDCTACGYCMPCEEGVDIPLNLSFYNQFHLFEAEEAKERCRFVYNFSVPRSDQATGCVDCGKCVEKCPQHIPIPEYLKKTAELYATA